VAAIAPQAAPTVLAHDPDAGFFAMTYLEPADHPVWKAELREGRADPAFAASVGRIIGAIHAATTEMNAQAFNSSDLFQAIRLEPYLETTARKHPEIAAQLGALVAQTLQNRHALVHGDVSPKNILCGPNGPVFLDAECAWFGDPAFDAAFCLNHLLLKCLWNRAATPDFLACFGALAEAYLAQVTWEPRDVIETRIASLLPALLLARIDGKSPVEYVTDEKQKETVRAFAVALIKSQPTEIDGIRQAWAETMEQSP
jgi:aminoglycoside phosphotransferase (APT) family kinase protein